jgi:hypothetical protein
MSGEEEAVAGRRLVAHRGLSPSSSWRAMFAIKLQNEKIADVGSVGVTAAVLETAIARQNSPPNGLERPWMKRRCLLRRRWLRTRCVMEEAKLLTSPVLFLNVTKI